MTDYIFEILNKLIIAIPAFLCGTLLGSKLIKTREEIRTERYVSMIIERYTSIIEDSKAEIEKQIERDFEYAKTEEVKVPCHYGTANGLQVALKIINGIIDEHIAERNIR